MPKCFIALGANLNEPKKTVQAVINLFKEHQKIQLIKASPLYQTAPVDSDGPDYINAVAKIATSLSPQQLLTELQAIENQYGRERLHKNSPRTLDLDILLYEDYSSQEEELTIPHPRMHERAFVLQPLKDIAHDLVLKQGEIKKLLEDALEQGQNIKRIES